MTAADNDGSLGLVCRMREMCVICILHRHANNIEVSFYCFDDWRCILNENLLTYDLFCSLDVYVPNFR